MSVSSNRVLEAGCDLAGLSIRRLLRRRADRLSAGALDRLAAGLAAGDPNGEVAVAWWAAQQLCLAYAFAGGLCAEGEDSRAPPGQAGAAADPGFRPEDASGVTKHDLWSALAESLARHSERELARGVLHGYSAGSGSGRCGSPAGTWGGPTQDPQTGIAVLRRAMELGVNHIDTAGFYGATTCTPTS